MGLVVMVTSATCVPFVVRFVTRYGKKEVMFFALTLLSMGLAGMYFVDPHVLRDTGAIFVMPVMLGITISVASTIPNALLSDIIDYDELHCERSAVPPAPRHLLLHGTSPRIDAPAAHRSIWQAVCGVRVCTWCSRPQSPS